MRIRALVTAAIVSALAITGAGAAATALAAGAPVKYVSGGVGEESSARMQALSKDFNLRLLFAAKDGHYLADVAVVITDGRGAKVLDAVAEGPWLLATLPAGKYEISATYGGTTVKQATTIPAAGRREVMFRWAEPQ